ncbi:kelch-like protein 40b [Physella acuta]|uniref:kelch-like protein 40b n=1 Tax=Physella acuta TaxID=109671 RepID=UPI0027DDE871|nr:kelch-like protein 40b [Physella acuta]
MFCDFTVKIDDESIKCHRLILAGCSEFFQALFRSRLREVTDNSVVLHDIPSEVFKTILNTLYSGEIDLTSENSIEIWRAVNMLQIMFLVELCESFAIDAIAIETWGNIYETAAQLSSKRCLDQLHIFMLKNFEEIRHSPTFLTMSVNEVKDLIKSQDLVVSKEDDVLESVLKWVAYVPKIMINSLEQWRVFAITLQR